jgi:ATP-dependent RNA helicase SUPV3L1/SUV3
MSKPDSSLTAILGPTNTGKTHLAVERMCAHASGMMGFPLRLLAREIYDRLVKIKGDALVALITGEEKIEPPNARYYCCTVESMPQEREFAFVAVDEAQLAADPERGHIFTDRMLHARGYSETMILGSESLRPLIRSLLPDAEIITRPRFSTLSYAGAKKLSRLPKRSAIVGFSVEQVYAVAETLRRLRGGCAVVMGALSPRTRNAQVDMFQSGEVDYLVATDAIGMGLNLDVSHVAFAGLGKFDGSRRRRLTVAEMAQIAGRAGRHQKDGSFGTLAGEAGEMTAEEILAIEDHRFPALDWIYWREAQPRFDNIATLIADLEVKPDRSGLRAAPEAIDLDVLKRLSENPDAAVLARTPALVRRMWEAACLPDFRQLGAEPHARFVAGLWQHLGTGFGHLPYPYVAGEIARLDTIQGDVATLSQRIAAVRTWTYIAHRGDWLADPTAMAQRTKALEEKLSDALHDALRQRFVDRRTSTLLRSAGMDTALLPVEIDTDKRVLVDGEDIGTLDGFAFRVDAGAKVGERKLFLAAAQRHLAVLLKQKARDVRMAQDIEFSLAIDTERKPAVFYKEDLLGHIVKGRSLMQPVFKPCRAVGDLEGDALQDITVRAEEWIAAQLEKHLGGVVALQAMGQNAEINGSVRALAVQLADEGGIAGRYYLNDVINALPKEERGAARKGGIVFGALDVFHHGALKPAAAKWRAALFAARDDRPMPDLPPESAVHLREWTFASAADCRNAGYRKIGEEYLRIDLAERVIKKAHETRRQTLYFGMDMVFATSLGMSVDGLNVLMRDAGFRSAQAPDAPVTSALTNIESSPEVSEQHVIDNAPDTVLAVTPEAMAETAPETAPEIEAAPVVEPIQDDSGLDDSGLVETTEPEAVVSEHHPDAVPSGLDHSKPKPEPVLSYWRWVGIRKPQPREAAGHNRKHISQEKRSFNSTKNTSKSERPHVRNDDVLQKPAAKPSPPSDLALQLAALQNMYSPKLK